MPYDSVHTWQLRGAHGRRTGGIGASGYLDSMKATEH